MTRYWDKIILVIILLFLGLFIGKSIASMITIPFNEFDEAHRAENAKQMREHDSLLFPLTGSVQDRIFDLRIPLKSDGFKFLYYHLERPPLVYDLMVFSTHIFGSNEFAYRLPSFVLGMMALIAFVLLIHYSSVKFNPYAFTVSFLCLITSADLWLSSQYAQLDTGLTTFLFISLLSLIFYVEKKRELLLIISAASFALAFLSKGQPVVLIIPAIAYLLFSKKITWTDVFKFIGYGSLLVLPWIIYVSWKFGFVSFFKVFTGFALYTTALDVIHHQAPIFWYARWWWETFRPGWALFLSFFAIDLIRNNLDWKKNTLLIFVLGNLMWLSLIDDKLWWYILPLIPPACFYLYLSISDYLKDSQLLTNLSLALVIASRPPLSGSSNKIAIFYGTFFTILVFYLLFSFKISTLGLNLRKVSRLDNKKVLFAAALVFSLFSFYIRFPQIIPYHWNIKDVASYYANLAGNKCLWIYDIPIESVLFYSNSGEVYTFNSNSRPLGHCQNFLMTSTKFSALEQEYRQGSMRLYKF